jgi:hypothetical protein
LVQQEAAVILKALGELVEAATEGENECISGSSHVAMMALAARLKARPSTEWDVSIAL